MAVVKICGLTRRQDIEAANALLPEYIGFVFAESRRRVTLEQARILKALLDRRVGAVGVFVNASLYDAAFTARECSLAAVQLHGDEDAEYVRALKRLLPEGCEIWKAARVKSADDIAAAAKTGADRLLLDAYSPVKRGGTGRCFDWSVIKCAAIDRPFFIAGGITPENAKLALRAAADAAGVPDAGSYGIDVSGGVETDGYKDYEKMSRLIAAVRGKSAL